jgi:hypothetical protein
VYQYAIHINFYPNIKKMSQAVSDKLLDPGRCGSESKKLAKNLKRLCGQKKPCLHLLLSFSKKDKRVAGLMLEKSVREFNK